MCVSLKKAPAMQVLLHGAPEGIRIPDLPLRRRTLYPAELPAHICVTVNAMNIIPYNREKSRFSFCEIYRAFSDIFNFSLKICRFGAIII